MIPSEPAQHCVAALAPRKSRIIHKRSPTAGECRHGLYINPKSAIHSLSGVYPQPCVSSEKFLRAESNGIESSEQFGYSVGTTWSSAGNQVAFMNAIDSSSLSPLSSRGDS